MKELIRHTLKEETGIQNRLNQLIKQSGIINASNAVGGFTNLVKILGLEMSDLKTQEMLVKNFIYHTDIEDVDILYLEINKDRPDKVRIKIHFDTNDPASNMESWLVRTLCDEINKFFPFKTAASWEPTFASRGVTVILNSKRIEETDEINESSYIRPEIRRRVRNLDRLVNAILPNLYTCDYSDGETFIQGVVDEIRWLSFEDDYGLQDLKFEELSDFVFNYMGDELIEYYEDRCSGMMESRKIIKKVLMEEEIKKLPSFFTRRIDHHKFEKMMRKGIPYIFHDSDSLEEFKYKLVEATLENYIHYKYEINIDELPQEDKDTFIKYMIEVYDPVLTAYYRNFYKR